MLNAETPPLIERSDSLDATYTHSDDMDIVPSANSSSSHILAHVQMNPFNGDDDVWGCSLEHDVDPRITACPLKYSFGSAETVLVSTEWSLDGVLAKWR